MAEDGLLGWNRKSTIGLRIAWPNGTKIPKKTPVAISLESFASSGVPTAMKLTVDSIPDGYEFHPYYPDPWEVAEKLTGEALSAGSKAWLISQGVSEQAMAGIVECRSGFLSTGGHGFHFVIDPKDDLRTVAVTTAFHLPVTHDGRLVDVLRFTRDHPGGFAWHGARICRAVSWLGAPLPPAFDDNGWTIPTPVWKTPLKWLRAGRIGLCFLRLSWRDERLGPLRRLPAILAEDIDHARWLDRTVWHWSEEAGDRPKHWARIPPTEDIDAHAAAKIMGDKSSLEVRP